MLKRQTDPKNGISRRKEWPAVSNIYKSGQITTKHIWVDFTVENQFKPDNKFLVSKTLHESSFNGYLSISGANNNLDFLKKIGMVDRERRKNF